MDDAKARPAADALFVRVPVPRGRRDGGRHESGSAAQAVGASRATGYRWWRRYDRGLGGAAGAPVHAQAPAPAPRRGRGGGDPGRAQRSGAGPVTLGAVLGRPASTVGKVRRRLGHSRRPRAPRPPVVRYERAQPGELLHRDTKKLGRFWHVGKRITRDGLRRSPRAGWQHVHVAIDDHSTPRCGPVRQGDALAFTRAGLVPRGAGVMTDYRSHAWRQQDLPPIRPANGKAERFIQILLHRWAYAA